MGLTVRQVVDSLATNGIMSASDLTSLREKVQAEIDNDAEPLLRDLVRQNKLTKFQAANLYAGRAKGLVFGEYLILDKIGAGGMGQVYKAQHRKMKRVVALKVLPPQSVGSQKAMQRFYQEVEVAAKLTHPNIVTAYDAGEAHNMLYLVMEFVDGKDLSSHISKHGPLTLEQTLNVVLQTARGLAYAHGLGIIHRDVKPSNLLVNRDKVVKILDMGLARVANPIGDAGPVGAELTASGEVMGTVDYMAPEQAMDTRTADHRADIYALGCTLYRLYVGRPVFAGETAVQKILAHRDKPIPKLGEYRPETPDIVERLYQKMMAKNLNERTQTMATIVQSLERLMSGVDEERSSVMLGAEPVEDDGTFLPSGVMVGGSTLGNLPGASNPGQSNIQKGKPAGSSIGGQAMPAIHPDLPQVAVAGKAVAAKRIATGDTDAGGQTKPFTSAAQRTAAVAPGAAAATDNKKKLLIAGGAGAAVLVAALGAFFLFGGDDEAANPPETAPAAAIASLPQPKPTPTPAPTNFGAFTPPPATTVASAPKPSATAPQPAASASATPTVVASLPLPTPAPSPTRSIFDLPPSPTATSDVPSPSPNPGVVTTATAVVSVPQSELTGEIDLLALVDPAKHARRGDWVRQGNDLYCDNGPGSGGVMYLDVPFSPPEEYDLTCVAIPKLTNITFGPGIVFGGRSCSVLANDDKLGLANLDGRHAYDGNNPTFRQGPYFTTNAPVTLVVAVRRGRIAVSLDNKRLIDSELSADRLSPEEPGIVKPGQLFLRSERGIRFTALRIGPPIISLTPMSAAVNLAAGFEQANVVEGTATQRRGEVLLAMEPSKYTKLQFARPHADGYVVRAVVERGSGNGQHFIINLPLGARRIGAAVDWREERFVGLHQTGQGPAEVNSTGRRSGLLLTPGELHVIEFRAVPDPEGYHFELTVDGREWVNHTTNDIRWDGGFDVPDKSAVGLTFYNGNLRVLRLDQFSADGRRTPVPDTKERAAAAETVRALMSQADAKGAPLDAKLLTVDLLRRKAATELSDAALRYEALDAATTLAASAGDLSGTYEAVEDLATAFDVDPRGFHPRILETFKAPRTNPAAKQQFIEEALKLTVRAARSEQFELALDLNAALEKYAATATPDMKREFKARATDYALAQSLQGPAMEARKKLAGGPDDAAARTALGLYYGCGLWDWSRAIKELAKCDDLGLQAIAFQEQGDMSTGDARFVIAEKWLEQSDKEKSLPLKWCYAERASYWYRRAAINVADSKRPILQRQMGKIAQLRKTSNGAGGPRHPLDAVKLGDHWYQLITNTMHADAAMTTCENWGGSLVILDNPAESQAVAQFVMQRWSALGAEKADVWLGANDLDKEGFFRRLDGVPLAPPAFTNWQDKEPNNSGGDEDYVCWAISLSSGEITSQWRDGQRHWGQMSTVCEWDH